VDGAGALGVEAGAGVGVDVVVAALESAVVLVLGVEVFGVEPRLSFL
jgi:hypothetical protein